MSDYTKVTDFEAKDALAPGNPAKVVKGTEFEVEFDAIAVAIATKADKASPTFTGTITTALTASRALVSSAGSELAVSAVTATELGYLSGVTSAIQTQLGTKAPTANPTFTGTDAGATMTRTGTITTTAGGMYCYGWGSNNNAGVLFLNSAGTRYLYNDGSTYQLPSQGLTVGGNVTASDFVISSDARLKHDIRVLRDSGELVDALTGYRFKFNDTERAAVGLIAQEVKQVLPELVYEQADGFLAVAYGPLVAVLLEEVKALRARVAALEVK